MAFPSTPVRDSFTGTNGTDLHVYSANWQSPVAGVTALEIQSNAATGTVAGGVNWQTWGTAYGPNEEGYVTLSTAPAAGQYVGIFTRVVNESSASTTDGYFLRYLDGVFAFFRVDNGAQTAVGAGISQTMSNGDSFGIESVGGTHTIYYKASGGAWTSLGTRSDSTYSAAGKLSLITGSTAVRFDDFGGGTRVLSVSAGQPAETDLAQAVTGRKTIAIGQATETDTAQAVAVSKALTAGQASETDLAQAVTATSSGGGGHTVVIGQATEVNEATPVNRVKVLGVTQTNETDSALAATMVKVATIAQAAETDLAQTATKAKVIHLAQPGESDSAQALTPRKVATIAAATETNFAQNVIPFKRRPVATAAETDTALPVATTGGGGGPAPSGSGWFRFWRIRRRA